MGGGDIILITGITGHVGLPTLFQALQASYRIRAPVRSIVKGQNILAHPILQPFSPSTLVELVEIPDITVPGAYDRAAKNCSAIIHLASPTPASYTLENAEDPTTFFDAAVDGTLNILAAAKKSTSVRRVVIASGVFALLPRADFLSGKFPYVVDATSRTKPQTPIPGDSQAAYHEAKIRALNAAEEWIASEHPAFEIVHLFMGFVIGRADARTNLPNGPQLGVNGAILRPITRGIDSSISIPAVSVHVEDAARAMVVLTQKEKTGTRGLILKSGGREGTRWEDVQAIVSDKFDAVVRAGVLPKSGRTVTAPLKVEKADVEEVLGFKLRELEDQVESLVSWYVDRMAPHL